MKKAFFALLLLVFFSFFSCENQTLNDFLPPAFQKEVPIKIGVQPFGNMDTALAAQVAKQIAAKYEFEVFVLPAIPLPENAFTDVKSPRYRADTIIHWLRDNRPDSLHHVIGLTNKDISVTKYEDWATRTVKKPEWKYKDFGIFGLGFRPGTACVVSTYRIKKKVNEAKFHDRLFKICWHELGHNLGLAHCPTDNCFMQDAAETIKTIDHAGTELCGLCKAQLP